MFWNVKSDAFIFACHGLYCAVLCLVTQSCPTLCDPLDCSPPGSSVHGISQARILEWVAMPPPGNLPNPGIKPRSPALQADSLPVEPPGKHLKGQAYLGFPLRCLNFNEFCFKSKLAPELTERTTILAGTANYKFNLLATQFWLLGPSEKKKENLPFSLENWIFNWKSYIGELLTFIL